MRSTPPRPVWLFTSNHPFTYNGGETMFVGPELPHLRAAFGSGAVTVVPLHDQGSALAVPEGVLVDRSLARDWRRWRLLAAALAPAWPGFFAEAWRGLRQGGWVGVARVWRWAAVAWVSWRWMGIRLQARPQALLYSYWRGGATLAATRWAAARPDVSVVTRVHRYELYEDAFSPPFQPWTAVYARLDRVIAVSQHGADHLLARGVPAHRVTLARLGVPAALTRARPSEDGVRRVVSCSTLTPVKRVPFTAQVMVALAKAHPTQRWEWVHFGGGPEQPAVEAVLAMAPPNLQTRLAGRVDHAEVLDHYGRQPVDLFLLLSESEGLPVAIQEALAAGIPVVACDAGGVFEALADGHHNEGLLPVDVGVEDAIRVLARLLLDETTEARRARRDAAWSRWAMCFDAPRNHAALARLLRDELN